MIATVNAMYTSVHIFQVDNKTKMSVVSSLTPGRVPCTLPNDLRVRYNAGPSWAPAADNIPEPSLHELRARIFSGIGYVYVAISQHIDLC